MVFPQRYFVSLCLGIVSTHEIIHHLHIMLSVMHTNLPRLNLQLLVFTPPLNTVDATFTTKYDKKKITKNYRKRLKMEDVT